MSRSIKIPFYKRTWTQGEIDAVVKCVKSGHMTHGHLVDEFERKFAKFVGAKYAVALNSCTSAVYLCLELLKPEKVSIPSMTFASMASCIIHAGGKIVWRDESWSGNCYPMVTDKPDKGTIFDSAHSTFRNSVSRSKNDLYCYSFYPTKTLSSAEGGMIATNNKKYADWLRKARWHARVGKTWDYVIEFPAWKMNMTDVQAAIGLDYLKRMDKEAAKRKKLVALYNKLLSTFIRSDHIFQTIVADRPGFVKFMADSGIECSMHFKPVHEQPAFRKYYVKLPKTDHFKGMAVSLPLYPSMTEKDVRFVCSRVLEWNKKHPLPRSEYLKFKAFLK